jgi:hypothetical protein
MKPKQRITKLKTGSSKHSSRSPLVVRVVTKAAEVKAFDRRLADQHYLGSTRPVGDFLRQIIERDGTPVAQLAWGSPALKLKDREAWIGWTLAQRAERLKLVVQNRRYLLLHDKGAEPNLASQALAAACRVLPQQWQEQFGYAPLLAETFTDPEAYAGTCYKASGWEPVGMSQGHSRHRPDFYLPNGRPKKLWMKELCAGAREKARAVHLDGALAQGCVAPASGVLPLGPDQCRSLLEVLRRSPDPRGRNTRFRIGPVLTLIAMALLGGARDVAQVARFATRLQPQQRAALGLPVKKGTRRFYEVPTYSVFYQVLTRMDPEAFALHLNGWLSQHAGALPAALSLDGKMIRDLIGTVTLADAEDGSPVAVRIMDQKEGTQRCEQTAARALIDGLGSLDGQTITGDPLHCQRELGRGIVEKGGEYLFQIKGNQPKLLEHARTLCQDQAPLLFRTNSGTDGSTSAA